jgi:single-strand DNA-binding protein
VNNLNSVNISGNLVNDVTPKVTNSGMSVAGFVVAVNRKYGETEETAFIECKMFGKLADAVAPYMTKGKGVIVGGRLSQEKWQANDGSNRSKLVIVVDFIQLLGDGKKADFDGERSRTRQNQRYSENGGTTTPSVGKSTGGDFYATGGGYPGPEQFDDDIPF